jgi:hypothetical protein
VDRFGGVPPFKETRNYVSTILGIKQDLLTPSMEEISANFVEHDRGLDGYTVRPQLRPEEPEMVQDPYAAAIAEAIEYQPPERTTGIGAFEQFLPADREASNESEELGPVDLKAIGEEEANMYNRYNNTPMTFQQARTAERKAMSGGIGPLNYIARNMYG